jgi:transposase-like protein
VERWQDSGLTAKEFASELNVNAGTLSAWKYKLRRESSSTERAARPGIRKAESASGFLRVVPVQAEDTVMASGFEIVVAARTIVRVPNDFDQVALIRLVRALGGF